MFPGFFASDDDNARYAPHIHQLWETVLFCILCCRQSRQPTTKTWKSKQQTLNMLVHLQIFLLLSIDSEREVQALCISPLSSYNKGSGHLVLLDFIPQGHNGLICKHNTTFLFSLLSHIDIVNSIVLNYRMTT